MQQNYWTTQSTYPWYDWNTNKQTGRSKSEVSELLNLMLLLKQIP